MTDHAHARMWKILLGGCLGALLGYSVARLILGTHGQSLLGWSDFGALLLGGMLLCQGFLVLGMSARTAATQPHYLRLQGGVLTLAGTMILLPVIIVLTIGQPPTRSVAWAAWAVIVLCFGVQSVLNLRLWRQSDEFLRRLIAETTTVCFWVLQSALFLWAAGERMQLLPAVNAWNCIVVLMIVYLLASAFISIRGGATAE